MRYELRINADGQRWDVVRAGEVVSTHATIKAAQDAKFELQSRKPQAIKYFKQDGTPVRKMPVRQ